MPSVDQVPGVLNARFTRGAAWEFASTSPADDARWNLFLPSAPTNLTATAGNALASLSWTAPTVLAQTPITDYLVQYSSNSGSTWTTFSDGTSTATSATVTGLTNGTAYVFRVAAANGVGTGAYTAASSSVTPADGVFVPIPAMASNTAPSGVVSGERNDDNSVLWRAFDGTSTGVFMYGSSNNFPKVRIEYAFPSGTQSLISGFTITPGSYNNIAQLNFYGSDDLSTWTLIQSFDGASPTVGQPYAYTLSQLAKYRAYRWLFQEAGTNAPEFFEIREIALVA